MCVPRERFPLVMTYDKKVKQLPTNYTNIQHFVLRSIEIHAPNIIYIITRFFEVTRSDSCISHISSIKIYIKFHLFKFTSLAFRCYFEIKIQNLEVGYF